MVKRIIIGSFTLILTIITTQFGLACNDSLIADSLQITHQAKDLSRRKDSLSSASRDSLRLKDLLLQRAKLQQDLNRTQSLLKRDAIADGSFRGNWRPSPKVAIWLSLACPGAGQIYNRKYWKLPIVIGAFTGCTYAIITNQRLYSSYFNAYRDFLSKDPMAHDSWKEFIPRGADPKSYLNNGALREQLKNGKDVFRRYRDLSIIATVGTYLLTMLDAYVDATLYNFDISDNLSMSVYPAVMPNQPQNAALGLACALKF